MKKTTLTVCGHRVELELSDRNSVKSIQPGGVVALGSLAFMLSVICPPAAIVAGIGAVCAATPTDDGTGEKLLELLPSEIPEESVECIREAIIAGDTSGHLTYRRDLLPEERHTDCDHRSGHVSRTVRWKIVD